MTVIANLLAGLGGTQAIAISVAAGLAVGVVGAATVGGAFDADGGAGAATLPVYACPDTAPELARIAAGQEMLVTGRTEDGSWVRIHFPVPGRTEAWVEAAPLALDGQLAEVPVAACGAAALVPPTAGPNPSLTAVLDPDVSLPPVLTPAPPSAAPSGAGPTPSSAPTTRPTPAPTKAAGDSTPPVVGAATLSATRIFSVTACGPTSATVSVAVTDSASGVAAVDVVVTDAATGAAETLPMSPPLIGSVWTRALSGTALAPGTYGFAFRARDAGGAISALVEAPGLALVSAGNCDTTPPTATVTGAPARTNGFVATFLVRFSETVTGVAPGDFALSGPVATSCGSIALSGSGLAYTVEVSCKLEGQLVLTLAALAGSDAVGNAGPTAAVAASVVFDRTPPTATITSPKSPTADLVLPYVVSFSEPVTGLAADDFPMKVSGTTCSVAKITDLGKSLRFQVDLSCVKTAAGTVVIALRANAVSDAARNAGPVAAIQATTVTLDLAAPAIANIVPLPPGPHTACANFSNAIQFEASATDPAGIGSVALVMTDPLAVVRTFPMAFDKLAGRYRVRLSWGTNTTGQPYPALIGSHTYRIRATDAVGNAASSASGTIRWQTCFVTTGEAAGSGASGGAVPVVAAAASQVAGGRGMMRRRRSRERDGRTRTREGGA